MRGAVFLMVLSGCVALQLFAANVTIAASSYSTPQQVFDGMIQSFRPEKAKGIRVLYQFDLSGPNGGSWVFEVNDGTLQTKRGRADNPDVTLIASDEDWVALSNGTLSGAWAFITGRLKIRGDKGLAKKLNEIFP